CTSVSSSARGSAAGLERAASGRRTTGRTVRRGSAAAEAADRGHGTSRSTRGSTGRSGCGTAVPVLVTGIPAPRRDH
ncbi:MAG: hypothetical protein AVDCRST_MAG52-3336, partial [uncultured Blastococcus sp.]